MVTGNVDTDKLILDLLSYIDFYHTCRVNQYLHHLCITDVQLKPKWDRISYYIHHPLIPDALLDDVCIEPDDFVLKKSDTQKRFINRLKRHGFIGDDDVVYAGHGLNLQLGIKFKSFETFVIMTKYQFLYLMAKWITEEGLDMFMSEDSEESSPPTFCGFEKMGDVYRGEFGY